jgi:hypothetical protein
MPGECTCVAPRCGDGDLNQPTEECDGPDSAACPGACLADCTCGVVAAVVEADVSVRRREPDERFGARFLLEVDGDTPKEAFLRMRLSGVGDRRITRATLRLQVASADNAESDSGGRIHAITSCDWNERTMTWRTRPPIDGPVLDSVGEVDRKDVVEFDVTTVVGGDGVYCFALDSRSEDGTRYNSREGRDKPPEFEVEVAP